MRYFCHKGFSLVELTVVLLLITLIASVAVRETSELAFQTRYEQTKERLEMIKQAILGNPRQIINGQQAISGFVADMGRLPVDLHELLEAQYCRPNRDVNRKNNPTDANTVCDANYGVGSWVSNKFYQPGYCLNGTDTNQASCEANNSKWIALGFGWHGPYLSASGSPADADVFSDGWGRLAPDAPDVQTQNYGWTLDYGFDVNTATPHPQNSARLVVQSYGKDQQVGGADYDADYPANRYSIDNSIPYTQPAPLVDHDDWLVAVSNGIAVDMLKPQPGNSVVVGTCPLNNPATHKFYTNKESCEAIGGSVGYWKTCSDGISTKKSDCLTAGAVWYGNGYGCDDPTITHKADCTGTKQWRSCSAGTAIQYTTKASCEGADGDGDGIADGIWFDGLGFGNGFGCSDSTYSNRYTCEAATKTWISCSITSYSNQVDCQNNGGVWFGFGQGCNNAAYSAKEACLNNNGLWLNDWPYCLGINKASPNSCINNGGTWKNSGKNICLIVFYRTNGLLNFTSSSRVFVEENGVNQIFYFTNFVDSSDANGNSNTTEAVNAIPIGQNAIGIYEYDGNCSPGNPLYPADRQNPIQVDFRAHTTLPVINW